MAHSIQPSKFYYVKSNSSFNACVNLMREKGLSFLLVENNFGKLVGIFTLKDLLKNYPAMTKQSNWDKPIRSFMSKPVLSLPAHKMHKAPQFMIDQNIRHLPITSDRTGEESRIVGVIDMESLLAHSLVEEKKRKYHAKEISVYSPNGSLMRLMKNAMQKYDLIVVDKLWASKLHQDSHFEAHVNSYDQFFFDVIDERSLRLTLQFVPHVNRARKRMVVLVNPRDFSSGASLDAIKKISNMSRVRVFEKPVNVHDLIFECLD